jgi:hypothetical protein
MEVEMRKTLLVTVGLLAAFSVVPMPPTRAAAGGDVVYEWNRLIQETVPAPQNVLTPRFFALTHLAMSDAINAVEREFTTLFEYSVPPAGSSEAAAAQAAHDILVAINPSASSVYDAALAAGLGGKSGQGANRVGSMIGAKVAQEILRWRQNDGWVVAPFPAYSEPGLPGRWQPTPPANANAAFTHLYGAMPLVLVTPTQFLPPPPPALTSAKYAADLEEIRAIGRDISSVRTSDQTTVARLWNGTAASGTGTATNFMSVWNNVARDATRSRNMSLAEVARVFAVMNMSVHDALQTAQVSKFVYGLWRPVTAIRNADADMNDATGPSDPSWLPLLPTPPYPSYAGNMATIGASAARALQNLFGTDDMQVTITWKQSAGQPDVSRSYSGFWKAADEQSESRIYGGIHYRFDQVAGQQIGRSVADYVFSNTLRPRRR